MKESIVIENESTFKTVGLYALNRINFDKFSELLKRAAPHVGDSYIHGKWELFRDNQLSFIVSYDEFRKEIIKEIIKTGYKG